VKSTDLIVSIHTRQCRRCLAHSPTASLKVLGASEHVAHVLRHRHPHICLPIGRLYPGFLHQKLNDRTHLPPPNACLPRDALPNHLSAIFQNRLVRPLHLRPLLEHPPILCSSRRTVWEQSSGGVIKLRQQNNNLDQSVYIIVTKSRLPRTYPRRPALTSGVHLHFPQLRD
jgi:hypothetical protein